MQKMPPKPPQLATEILRGIVSSFVQASRMPDRAFDPRSGDLGSEPSVLRRLVKENPWEKAALAYLYDKHVIRPAEQPKDWRTKSPKKNQTPTHWSSIWQSRKSDRPPAIFIESGSTCAYVSELLRRLTVDDKKRLRPFLLNTNNDLTAWLFLNQSPSKMGTTKKGGTSKAGTSKHVAATTTPPLVVPNVVAGRLESKYHGIFPFYSASPTEGSVASPDERFEKERKRTERQNYARLRLELASSDLLLLAASRLSLRFGPIVGSRENAIFKNACYNACVPPLGGQSLKEVHLFLTIQKLVAHDDENQQRKLKGGSFEGFHTWGEELNNIDNSVCYPAFSVNPEDEDVTRRRRRRGPFASQLVPDNAQRLRDGTSAVEMGEGRFRICDTWQDLFVKANLTVKVFVAFPLGPLGTDYADWINREVDFANREAPGMTFRYQNVAIGGAPDSKRKFGLCCIEMAAAKQPQ